jgi:hypothetical protein
MVVGWGSSFFGATPARRPYACNARMVFRETRPSSLLFLPFEKGFWFWIYIVFTCIFSDFRVHPYASFLHFLALLCVSCKRWVLVLSYVIVFSILLRDATNSMSKCIISSVHLSRRSPWEVKWASGFSWGHIILSHRCFHIQVISSR